MYSCDGRLSVIAGIPDYRYHGQYGGTWSTSSVASEQSELYQAVWRRRHRQQGERSGDGEGRDGPAMDGVPAATSGTAVPAAIGGAVAPVGMGGAAAPAAIVGAVAMGGTEAMGGRTTGNDFETWKSDVLHAGTEAAKATWLYICCYEQCSLHINC